MTRIDRIVKTLVTSGEITSTEGIAIIRCLSYSDQIADVSIGSFFRTDVAALLSDDHPVIEGCVCSASDSAHVIRDGRALCPEGI